VADAQTERLEVEPGHATREIHGERHPPPRSGSGARERQGCTGGHVNQSVTFIDVAGNRAQYTVSDSDRDNNFHWSTDHGDHGHAASFSQAQYRARTVLRDSMAASRRSEEAHLRGPMPFRSLPLSTPIHSFHPPVPVR
jgi:hypothetical protein